MCTATTVIYTVGHTLSLHDALPILAGGGERRGEDQRQGGGKGGQTDRRGTEDRHGKAPGQIKEGRAAPSGATGRLLRLAIGAEHRSEEHTSELQSLMRISYAVFCLKKKNIHKPDDEGRK